MEQIYTAKEIAEILQNEGDAEIALRTVRHYAEIGILPERILINGRKRFTQIHLDYLRALRTMQKTGESLDNIKGTLDSLKSDNIRSIGTKMNHYSTETLINTQTYQFSPDVSFSFSNHLSPATKERIVASVSSILNSENA